MDYTGGCDPYCVVSANPYELLYCAAHEHVLKKGEAAASTVKHGQDCTWPDDEVQRCSRGADTCLSRFTRHALNRCRCCGCAACGLRRCRTRRCCSRCPSATPRRRRNLWHGRS